MYTLLIFISVIIAALLIVVVLLQSSKGGGLAGSFGGVGQFGTVFGTRRTADFLSKATWWLGGGLMVLAIVINLFFLPGVSKTSERSVIQSGSQQAVPTAPALPQQSAPVQNKK
jgi:preprotein translocase subunit SecG